MAEETKDKVDCLETKDFYEIMQAYRHADMGDQMRVVDAFEAVKNFIRENYK